MYGYTDPCKPSLIISIPDSEACKRTRTGFHVKCPDVVGYPNKIQALKNLGLCWADDLFIRLPSYLWELHFSLCLLKVSNEDEEVEGVSPKYIGGMFNS